MFLLGFVNQLLNMGLNFQSSPISTTYKNLQNFKPNLQSTGHIWLISTIYNQPYQIIFISNYPFENRKLYCTLEFTETANRLYLNVS